jgi:hypothetical protein
MLLRMLFFCIKVGPDNAVPSIVLPGGNGDGVLELISRKDANLGMVHRLGWQLHCHPCFTGISRGDSTTATPTIEPCPNSTFSTRSTVTVGSGLNDFFATPPD